jgi:hypothetical protein
MGSRGRIPWDSHWIVHFVLVFGISLVSFGYLRILVASDNFGLLFIRVLRALFFS